MNKDSFIKEMLEFEGFDCVEFELSDGYTYTIEAGENFLGGIEGTFESELLGHVAYDTYISCVFAVAKYIYDELNETVSSINI